MVIAATLYNYNTRKRSTIPQGTTTKGSFLAVGKPHLRASFESRVSKQRKLCTGERKKKNLFLKIMHYIDTQRRAQSAVCNSFAALGAASSPLDGGWEFLMRAPHHNASTARIVALFCADNRFWVQPMPSHQVIPFCSRHYL